MPEKAFLVDNYIIKVLFFFEVVCEKKDEKLLYEIIHLMYFTEVTSNIQAMKILELGKDKFYYNLRKALKTFSILLLGLDDLIIF